MDDVNFKGKKVFVRVDFNVPLGLNAQIAGINRITQTKPTIIALLEGGARTITLASHWDPLSDVKPLTKDPRLRMNQIADVVQTMLPGVEVEKVDYCIGSPPAKQLVVLENLRFEEGETANDATFARQLIEPYDVIVYDAFGVAHRAHSSTTRIMKDRQAVVGKLMLDEVMNLNWMMVSPKRPLLAMMGGAKLSTKLTLIKHLLSFVDRLVIGGAMAFTFAKAKGINVGASLVELNFVDEAARLLADYPQKIVLPVDTVDNTGRTHLFDEGLPSMGAGCDIGARTVSLFISEVANSGTVFWNGPFGIYEDSRFRNGTVGVASFVSTYGVKKIIGGGDLVAAISLDSDLIRKLKDTGGHASTGGAASLQYIESVVTKTDLPAIAALKENAKNATLWKL
ncbi:MAG: Phosphoglycerate kinase [Parcubacteria group bacterium GW2011_GWC2_44_22]|nr:MAG: Phosphoglycerate kinase [Parcubacteria group bacterium GW2011_GWC2_44_22]